MPTARQSARRTVRGVRVRGSEAEIDERPESSGRMRSSSERALRLGLLAAAALLLAAPAAGADDEGDDDESDSAPFMIVVERGAAPPRRCSGSLVSMRTGVTSAWCVRDAAARDLWALAAATAAGLASRAVGARRVSRVASAGADDGVPEEGAAGSAGAPLDLAVLELEAPFGGGAHARPILMATAPDECAAGERSVCHVVRALPGGDSARARLRIVDALLADEGACSSAARFWAAVRDRALCLRGPELCASDRGAGVVCGGKLCGVVSRSARAGDAVDATAGVGCGDTHVAQSVARWRRFLHCAHTLRACGRGACAELCSERRLLEDAESEAPTAAAPLPVANDGSGESAPRDRPADGELRASSSPSPAPPAAARTSRRAVASTRPSASSRRAGAPTRTSPGESAPPGVVPMAPSPASVRPSPLFEPNRPDFKAGEYGDNAAEYGVPGDDVSPSPAPPPPTRSPASPSTAARRVSAAMRRVAPPAAPSAPRPMKNSAPTPLPPLVSAYAAVLLLYWY